jgi:hypothetical protein
MKLILKNEYKNTKVSNSKTHGIINTAELKEEQYEYYFNHGLSFLFEQVIDNRLTEAIKQMREYSFIHKSRGRK